MAIVFVMAIQPALAGSTLPAPNWDRAMAIQTIQAADTEVAIDSLFEATRSGDTEALLELIRSVEQDPTRSAPELDYIFHSYAVGLSDFDADRIDSRVLAELAARSPATWVSSHDHPDLAMPLFNTRAAIEGTQNAWRRQQASYLAQDLMTDSSRWVQEFIASDSVERRGYLDALELAPAESLHAIGGTAAQQMDQHPQLAHVVARSGIRSGDVELTWKAIKGGTEQSLPQVLREVSTQMEAGQCGELLVRSMELNSVTRQSLAIAQLAPKSLKLASTRDLLFDRLGDPQLGSAAALVLANSKDPEIHARLTTIAQQTDGLASKRANLAMNLRQSGAGVE